MKSPDIGDVDAVAVLRENRAAGKLHCHHLAAGSSIRNHPCGVRVSIPSREFEICSQWIEVLPTDPVVPVEVAYDPKTGRQV